MIAFAQRHGLGIAVLVLGAAYALFTAPFGVPDEFGHFWRACQISEGRLLAERPRTGGAGGILPRSVDDVVETLVRYRSVPIPSTYIDWPAWKRAWKMGFNPNDRAYCSFPATADYSPVIYLPAALVLAFSRACHLSVLAAFYLARLANVLAVAALVSLAWRRLPLIRESFALVALLPMTLFLVGSLSADAVTFGIALLWIALVLHHTTAATISRGQKIELFVVAALLGQTKFFFPLPFFALLWVFRGGRSRALLTAGVIAVALLSAAFWYSQTDALSAPTRLDLVTGPTLQSAFVRAHPLRFLEICVHTFQTSLVTYGRQIVGVLGWLQVRLRAWIYLGTWIALVVSTGFQNTASRSALNVLIRLLCLALALAMLLFVYLALYGKWTAVGAPFIEGVQGRYFIPLLPLLAIAGASPLWLRLGLVTPVRVILYLWILFTNGWALTTLFRASFS